MRYFKKFLLVGFITSVLILSFSMSASAFTLQDTYNYNFGDSWHGMFHTPTPGQRIIQVFYLNRDGVPEYVESLYTFTDSGGAPVLTDSIHYAYQNIGTYWLTLYWAFDDQFDGCQLSNIEYKYDKDGNLLRTSDTTFIYLYPYNSSNIPCAVRPYAASFHGFDGSQYAVPWGTGFLTGGIKVYNGAGSSLQFTSVNTLGFNFTINGQDPVPPGEGDDSGGEGGSSCCCSSYDDYLIDIITNQESQLTKLNQIITILQNFNNDDVVSAVNDAVDDVINSGSEKTVPSIDTSQDDEREQIDNDLPQLDEDDMDEVIDNIDMSGDAISWLMELIDDVTSNTKLRTCIILVMSLSLVAFILNKKGS